MDSSNRQNNDGRFDVGLGEGIGAVAEELGIGNAEVAVSDQVAVIANLKKIGCDELTPKQWVELINVALAHAKPYLKYLPFFLPAIKRKLKKYCFSLNFSNRGESRVNSFWLEEDFIVKLLPSSDGALKAFVIDAKVVQICEVSDSVDRLKSMKVLLNTHGVFILAHCHYPEPEKGMTFSFNDPNIDRVEILKTDDELEKVISSYPQVGVDTLFAISTMVNDTYQQRVLNSTLKCNIGRKT